MLVVYMPLTLAENNAIAARHLLFQQTVTHFAHVDLTPAAFSAAVRGTT